MVTLTAGIIAKPEHAAVLRKRLSEDSDVVVFSDADSLHIFDALVIHPPKILALDTSFAATARGASLIARIKGEPALQGIELRLLLDDEDLVPFLLDQQLTAPRTAILKTSRPLERCGTRRAVRYPMERMTVTLNGERGQLVDLSVSGAQVLSMMRLQPGHPIRLSIPEPVSKTDVRCHGTIAWSIAAPFGAAVQYRAGIEFLTPDSNLLSAFCDRYGKHPDTTFGSG